MLPPVTFGVQRIEALLTEGIITVMANVVTNVVATVDAHYEELGSFAW